MGVAFLVAVHGHPVRGTDCPSKSHSDVNQLGQAIKLFHFEMGRMPADLLELVQAGCLKGRISVPRDAWKREYSFRLTDADRVCTLGTFGRDGRFGGRGRNSDVLLRLRFDGSGPDWEWVAGPYER